MYGVQVGILPGEESRPEVIVRQPVFAFGDYEEESNLAGVGLIYPRVERVRRGRGLVEKFRLRGGRRRARRRDGRERRCDAVSAPGHLERRRDRRSQREAVKEATEPAAGIVRRGWHGATAPLRMGRGRLEGLPRRRIVGSPAGRSFPERGWCRGVHANGRRVGACEKK